MPSFTNSVHRVLRCRNEHFITSQSIRYFAKKAKTKADKKKEKHNPSIMQNEILHIFNTKYPKGTFLDASFGEGGHSIN